MIDPYYLEFFLNQYRVDVNAIDNNGNSAIHHFFQDLDITKAIESPEKCYKIVQNVMDRNCFLSFEKNHLGLKIADIVKERIEEATLMNDNVLIIQTMMTCYEIIKVYENKARWQMFLYIILHIDEKQENQSAI
jgi:hypothetical protein